MSGIRSKYEPFADIVIEGIPRIARMIATRLLASYGAARQLKGRMLKAFRTRFGDIVVNVVGGLIVVAILSVIGLVYIIISDPEPLQDSSTPTAVPRATPVPTELPTCTETSLIIITDRPIPETNEQVTLDFKLSGTMIGLDRFEWIADVGSFLPRIDPRARKVFWKAPEFRGPALITLEAVGESGCSMRSTLILPVVDAG